MPGTGILSAAVTTTLAMQPAQVRVLLYELPPEHWAVGGQSKAARAACDRAM